MAASAFDFPAPGSPIRAQIGPGRIVRRRALRKLTTRSSWRSALTCLGMGRAYDGEAADARQAGSVTSCASAVSIESAGAFWRRESARQGTASAEIAPPSTYEVA